MKANLPSDHKMEGLCRPIGYSTYIIMLFAHQSNKAHGSYINLYNCEVIIRAGSQVFIFFNKNC